MLGLAATAAILGLLAGLAGLVAHRLVVARVARLAAVPPATPERWPLLSVVIPACNEAATLEAALGAHLRSDYPALELILVDDRSSDETGAIADRLAATDARLSVIHLAELREGWLGKTHALQVGLERARGEWILFADADTRLEPAALRRAVGLCEARALDLLAVVPGLDPAGPLLDALAFQFYRNILAGARAWEVEDPRARAAIGVGAFNLVRRAALERSEGLAWMRLEVADDMALALLLKRSGARCAVANGRGLVALRLYSALGEMARALEKNSYAILGRYRATRAILLALAPPLVDLLPVLGLVLPAPPWVRATALAALALAQAGILLGARWLGAPLRAALLAIPANLVLSALLIRGAILGWRRGGILWRGTLYPAKQLREGIRVRFP